MTEDWYAILNDQEEEDTRVEVLEPIDVIDPYAPAGGWHPDDFPKISAVLIPYSSNSGVRSDPSITIIPEGWMFLELGHVRVAIPDRDEWAKLVNMGERLWNTHQRDKELTSTADEDDDFQDEDAARTEAP